MSHPRPSRGFCAARSWGFRSSKSILHSLLKTCPNFDHAEFVIFYAGVPPCHFVTIAVRIRTLSMLAKLKFSLLKICSDQSKPFNVRPSIICHSMCGPGQDSDTIFGSVSHLGWTQLSKSFWLDIADPTQQKSLWNCEKDKHEVLAFLLIEQVFREIILKYIVSSSLIACDKQSQ